MLELVRALAQKLSVERKVIVIFSLEKQSHSIFLDSSSTPFSDTPESSLYSLHHSISPSFQKDIPTVSHLLFQIVEAGVDLDFPLVYRAISPLDRIVQAAGRCNREGKLDKGNVVICNPQDGKVPPGEYETAVNETTKLLKRKNIDLHDPNIFTEYFQCLYQDLDTDKKQIQKYRRGFDYPEVADRFKLIPDDTTPVIINYDNPAS